jgi:hypothetical protein
MTGFTTLRAYRVAERSVPHMRRKARKRVFIGQHGDKYGKHVDQELCRRRSTAWPRTTYACSPSGSDSPTVQGRATSLPDAHSTCSTGAECAIGMVAASQPAWRGHPLSRRPLACTARSRAPAGAGHVSGRCPTAPALAGRWPAAPISGLPASPAASIPPHLAHRRHRRSRAAAITGRRPAARTRASGLWTHPALAGPDAHSAGCVSADRMGRDARPALPRTGVATGPGRLPGRAGRGPRRC